MWLGTALVAWDSSRVPGQSTQKPCQPSVYSHRHNQTTLSWRWAVCSVWAELEVRGLDLGLMFLLRFMFLHDLGDISVHCPSRFLRASRSQLGKLQLADRARVPARAVHVNWYILHKVFSVFWPNVAFEKWVIISSWLNYYFEEGEAFMNDPRENPGCESSRGHTLAEATGAPEVWLSGAFLGTGVWLPPFSGSNAGFHLMHCLNFTKPFMCTT